MTNSTGASLAGFPRGVDRRAGCFFSLCEGVEGVGGSATCGALSAREGTGDGRGAGAWTWGCDAVKAGDWEAGSEDCGPVVAAFRRPATFGLKFDLVGFLNMMARNKCRSGAAVYDPPTFVSFANQAIILCGAPTGADARGLSLSIPKSGSSK